jgi:hypothetical protein
MLSVIQYFSEEVTDEARKNAKELFLKLQKELPRR